MSQKYILNYFNGRGRGEICRLALVYAEADWEDKRIPFDEWPAVKPTTQLSFLPALLTNDGKFELSESTVIPQYIAETCGFGGANAEERSRIAMIVKYMDDLFAKIAKAHFEKNEDTKAELTKDLQEKQIPPVFKNLEKLGKDNGNDVFVGSGITVADLLLQNIVYVVTSEKLNCNILEEYPTLKGVYEKVVAVPAIKGWLDTRPDTPF